jgi:hypothetical protein
MTLWHHFKALQPLSDITWGDAWYSVLGGIYLNEGAAALLGLIDESRTIISARPDLEVASLFHQEPHWRQAILLHNINIGAAIKASGFQLSAEAVNGLYGVAAIIKGLPSSHPDPADEDLIRLDERIGELHDAVLKAEDLESELRAFLLEQVGKMQLRLDRRRVSGPGPVHDLIEETIGSSAVQASLWARAMESSVGTRILAVFIAFNTITGFVNTTATAIDSTEQAVHTVTSVVQRVVGEGPKQITSGEHRLASELSDTAYGSVEPMEDS